MNFPLNLFARLAAIIAAAAALAGCGVILNQHPDEVVIRAGPDTLMQGEARAYAGFFAPYAILAAWAYDDIDPANPRKILKINTTFGPDKARITSWKSGWKHVDGAVGPLDCPGTAADCGSRLDGLQYMIFTHGGPVCDEIVVAFRGTDFKSSADWKSNLRWFRRALPEYDQYEQVQAHIKDIVDRKMKGQACYRKGTRLTATGHSLGGGLAQNAAYANSDITRVYAFDPSFVTGYYDIHNKPQDPSLKQLVIERVYEHGEILAYPRFALKNIYPPSPCKPLVRQFRFDRDEGLPADEHSMEKLAVNLVKLARTPAEARRTMAKVSPLPLPSKETLDRHNCNAAVVAWIKE